MKLLPLLVMVATTPQLLFAADHAMILVVRHAEKQAGMGDVALTPRGRARSLELARIASLFNVSAIYCTDTTRSRQTAQPAAANAPLRVYETPSRDWADQVINTNRGAAVLVIAHSDTVPVIVKHFGGGSTTIADDEFDKLIVMRVSNSETTMSQLRYGEDRLEPLQPFSDKEMVGFTTGASLFETHETIRLDRQITSPIEVIARELTPEVRQTSVAIDAAISSTNWEAQRKTIQREPTYRTNVARMLNKSILADSPVGQLGGSQYRKDFIIGNEEANRDATNEFFTTVFIGWSDQPTKVCTGVVIAPNVVLTANHCQADPPDFVYTANAFFPPNPEAYIRVTGTPVQHTSLDLALLKIEQEVDFQPSQLVDENSLLSFNDVTVAGYGYSEEISASSGFGIGSGIRRRVTVPIRSYVTTDEDATKFKAKRDQEFILGGTLAGATCFGDSGGPAFVMTNDGWRLLGITSGSLPAELWIDPDKACGNGSKSVRCDATEIRAWIVEETESLRN